MDARKSYRMTEEQIAKRTATLRANGKRHRKPVIIGGVEHWVCCTCRVVKLASEYYAARLSPNGLKAQCKKCHTQTALASRSLELKRQCNRRAETIRNARKRELKGIPYRKSDLKRLFLILGHACLACGSEEALQWDHVIPIGLGGLDCILNLQPLCRSCNERKHLRDDDFRTPDQRREVATVWCVEVEKV